MKLLLLILIIFASISNISAQKDNYSSKNKKAIKNFEMAYAYFDKRDDTEAIKYAEQALKADEKFVEVYLLLAEIYNQSQNLKKEIEQYKTILQIDAGFSYRVYYLLAKVEYSMGLYHEAQNDLEPFFLAENPNKKIEYYAKHLKKCLEFSVNAFDNPVPFKPVITSVSTEFDDYWPSLTADELKLLTTVQIPIDSRFPVSDKNRQEDLFISNKQKDGTWSPVINMGPPINTPNNEGAQSFRADGQQLFLTVCNRPQDLGSCDLYVANKVNGKWTNPKNVGRPVNSSAWEAQPTVSADGRRLYFSCGNCPGSLGAADIYVSNLDENGNWTQPKNLGATINTAGNEFSPFIHPDGKTLYFASEGHIGLGGMDLYVSYLENDTAWSTPVNLGYPINTNGDEVGLIVNALGDYAYFSSQREGSQGLDIFGFEMPASTRPSSVTYAKGVVYDAITKERLQADFQLTDLSTGKIVLHSQSEQGTGEFLVTLPMGREYALNASKEKYLFFSENYQLIEVEKGKPYIIDVPLQPIVEGASIILKNVFFKTDSYELDDKSVSELNKLVMLLNNNPTIKIEISGHTDNKGSFEYNKTLSHNRAKSVMDYLINQGISKLRLTFAGYSFSKPIATNDTDEGRALNRRTEFKITSLK